MQLDWSIVFSCRARTRNLAALCFRNLYKLHVLGTILGTQLKVKVDMKQKTVQLIPSTVG